MALPGYVVNLINTSGVPSILTNFSTAFAVGKATIAGAAKEIFSIDQFVSFFGARDPSSALYDGLDAFFHEGGSRAVVAATAIAGTDVQVAALCAQFDESLGGGMIIAPGNISLAVQTAMMAQALTSRRIAILDGTDTPIVATLTAQATALAALSGSRVSGMFAPWDVCPGVASGTTRIIPPSGRIAGNLARNDGLGKTLNDPAAGDLGVAQWAQSLSQVAWSDSDRTTLSGVGVNVTRMVYSTPRTYGWRSLTSQTTDANWSKLSNSRCCQGILRMLEIVAEHFEFNKIDSRNHTLMRFRGAIIMALQPEVDNDDLWAFSVDIGPSVNTLATIAADEIHARVALQFSEFGERVLIDVAKVPATESIAA